MSQLSTDGQASLIRATADTGLRTDADGDGTGEGVGDLLVDLLVDLLGGRLG